MCSQRKNIPHLEQWAEGQSFLLALLAPQTAVSAHDVSQVFSQVKNRRIGDLQFPLPPLPAWFRLYRSHRELSNFNKEMISLFFPSGREFIEFADAITKELRLRSRGKTEQSQFTPSEDEAAAAQEYLQKVLSASAQDLENDLSDIGPSQSERDIFTQLRKENELVFSFFILVHVPCWLLYQMSPTRLYQKASAGNVDALDKLLRLDPLMLHDQKIGNQLLKIRYEGKISTYRSLLEAPLKSLGKISQKRIKSLMAGYLSAIATELKQPLTEPDIKKLYDAAAKDRSKDSSAIDASIPESPESFYKAIYRNRQPWLDAMKPDKKI